MSVLRAALGLELAGLCGQVVVAPGGGDEFARRVARLVRNADGVGTHVGDQGHGARLAQFHAFVQALGDVHGALGRIPQPLAGRLLDGRGDERGLRLALAFLFVDAGNDEGLALHGRFHGGGVFRAADGGLLAVQLVQVGPEGGRGGPGQARAEQPVLLGVEGTALGLAVHDQAQGHGLHAPGGNAALHLLPQQGGKLVAHQPVQHAAGLLGVEQVAVQFARVVQRFLYRAGGDFVELDAPDVLVLVADQFRHVPGNGLSLAVGVGRKVDVVGLGGGFLEGGNHLLLAVYDLVAGGKAVGLVDAQFAGGQVAHVAHAGMHGVVAAKEFLDGLHLGGGFDDDQVLAHDCSFPGKYAIGGAFPAGCRKPRRKRAAFGPVR